MELYAAIDLHSNYSVIVVIDAEAHTVFSRRLRNYLNEIVNALPSCPGDLQAVAIESTYSCNGGTTSMTY